MVVTLLLSVLLLFIPLAPSYFLSGSTSLVLLLQQHSIVDDNAWNIGRRTNGLPVMYAVPRSQLTERALLTIVIRLVANNFWGKEDAGVGPMLDRMHCAKSTCDELKTFYNRAYPWWAW